MSHHPFCVVAAVLLGSFLTGFHTRLFALGLPDLRGAFGLSVDEASWLSTAALAPQILISPAVAWATTVFGVRRVLCGPSLIYAGIMLAIPFCRDPALLIGLHVLSALLLGLFVPATLGVIVRNLPMTWWLPAFAIYAFRMSFTLNSGATMMGFYIDHLGWEWLYWQDVPIAPAMGLLAWLGAPREAVRRQVLRDADWGGMLLFGTGLTLIYAGLDQGNRLDWGESGTVTALLIGGVVLLLAFVVNELVVPEPWASPAILGSRNLILAFLVAMLFTITIASNSALMPNFLINVAQLRPEQIGPLLLHGVAMPLFITVPAAVILLRRFDSRYVLIIGLAALAAASLCGTRLTADWRLGDFAPMAMLHSVGMGFTFIAVIVTAFANANPARATAISAYIQVIRLGGLEIGAAAVTTLLRVREQVHSHLLGLHVTASSAPVREVVAARTAAYADAGAAEAHGRALSSLAGMVQRQANVLAYIDGFWFTFGAAVLGLLLVAAMKAPPPGPFSHRRPAPRP